MVTQSNWGIRAQVAKGVVLTFPGPAQLGQHIDDRGIVANQGDRDAAGARGQPGAILPGPPDPGARWCTLECRTAASGIGGEWFFCAGWIYARGERSTCPAPRSWRG